MIARENEGEAGEASNTRVVALRREMAAAQERGAALEVECATMAALRRAREANERSRELFARLIAQHDADGRRDAAYLAERGMPVPALRLVAVAGFLALSAACSGGTEQEPPLRADSQRDTVTESTAPPGGWPWPDRSRPAATPL